MATRKTDRQKKKIIADYVELGSYSAVAKLTGIIADHMESLKNTNNHAYRNVITRLKEVARK